jgi:YHYH protein
LRSIFLFTFLLSLVITGAKAHTVDLTSLPLRDGDVSSTPRVGSVFACQARFNPNAPGAQRSGDWLNEAAETFDLTRKPTVDGHVVHVSELEIAIAGVHRQITGNALPNHATGQFPVARSDDAYYYDRNPNRIQAHRFNAALPLYPIVADRPSCVPMGAIGIMLTGAVLFNALDARGENALAHEILDVCQGHPQRSGLYHYHGKSPCQDDPAPANEHSTLIGYAFDGFGIYGYHGEGGAMLSSADLDVCHGHVGAVMIDGQSQTTYHYHATPDYPYTVSCFRGEPVSVAALAERVGPPQRGGQGRTGRSDRPSPRRPW